MPQADGRPEPDTFSEIPVIDVSPLLDSQADHQLTAKAIHRACRESGFFYIKGHSVDLQLQKRLAELSQEFFAQDESTKMQIRMALGGRAWRGYFPLGSELTSGLPDLKEGLYLGADLGPEHPEVKAKTPLHGANLYPAIAGFKNTILDYMQAVTALGHVLMRGISLSLGLEPNFFADHYTQDPLILFRIFHYPPASDLASAQSWGVGEHTDYGLLTILKQDAVGGLEVKSRSSWVAAPPIENTFVCNIGDMLDRMTGGLYRSTPHRVRNKSGEQRFSFPLFFDPGFRVEVKPVLEAAQFRDDRDERWDKASVHSFQGSYADYLLAKLGKVFPDLEGELESSDE